MFIHTAAAVGGDGGAGGEQGVAGAHWRQSVVHYHVLQLGGGFVGAVVDSGFPLLGGAVVVADGAVVQVQSGGAGHVRTGEVGVEIRGAVAHTGLLLDRTSYKVGGIEGGRGHHSESMSAGLDLKLLDVNMQKQNEHN